MKHNRVLLGFLAAVAAMMFLFCGDNIVKVPAGASGSGTEAPADGDEFTDDEFIVTKKGSGYLADRLTKGQRKAAKDAFPISGTLQQVIDAINEKGTKGVPIVIQFGKNDGKDVLDLGSDFVTIAGEWGTPLITLKGQVKGGFPVEKLLEGSGLTPQEIAAIIAQLGFDKLQVNFNAPTFTGGGPVFLSHPTTYAVIKNTSGGGGGGGGDEPGEHDAQFILSVGSAWIGENIGYILDADGTADVLRKTAAGFWITDPVPVTWTAIEGENKITIDGESMTIYVWVSSFAAKKLASLDFPDPSDPPEIRNFTLKRTSETSATVSFSATTDFTAYALLDAAPSTNKTDFEDPLSDVLKTVSGLAGEIVTITFTGADKADLNDKFVTVYIPADAGGVFENGQLNSIVTPEGPAIIAFEDYILGATLMRSTKSTATIKYKSIAFGGDGYYLVTNSQGQPSATKFLLDGEPIGFGDVDEVKTVNLTGLDETGLDVYVHVLVARRVDGVDVTSNTLTFILETYAAPAITSAAFVRRTGTTADVQWTSLTTGTARYIINSTSTAYADASTFGSAYTSAAADSKNEFPLPSVGLSVTLPAAALFSTAYYLHTLPADRWGLEGTPDVVAIPAITAISAVTGPSVTRTGFESAKISFSFSTNGTTPTGYYKVTDDNTAPTITTWATDKEDWVSLGSVTSPVSNRDVTLDDDVEEQFVYLVLENEAGIGSVISLGSAAEIEAGVVSSVVYSLSASTVTFIYTNSGFEAKAYFFSSASALDFDNGAKPWSDGKTKNDWADLGAVEASGTVTKPVAALPTGTRFVYVLIDNEAGPGEAKESEIDITAPTLGNLGITKRIGSESVEFGLEITETNIASSKIYYTVSTAASVGKPSKAELGAINGDWTEATATLTASPATVSSLPAAITGTSGEKLWVVVIDLAENISNPSSVAVPAMAAAVDLTATATWADGSAGDGSDADFTLELSGDYTGAVSYKLITGSDPEYTSETAVLALTGGNAFTAITGGITATKTVYEADPGDVPTAPTAVYVLLTYTDANSVVFVKLIKAGSGA